MAKMNAVAVFTGLLLCGWLRGMARLRLGTPIIVSIKVVAGQVDSMQAIAELLGE